MRPFLRCFLLLLAGLTIVLLGWTVATFIHRPILRSVPLSNGVNFRVLGLTYGTNHVSPGPFRLRHRLPPKLQAWIEKTFRLPAPVRRTTSDPRLVVWYGWSPGVVTNFTGVVSLELNLGDDHGIASGKREWVSLSPRMRQPHAVEFPAFPRRSASMRLLVFERAANGDSTPRGEFELPNPCPGDWEPWEPEALPIMRRSGEFQMTLERVLTGVDGSTSVRREAGGKHTLICRPGDAGEENSTTLLAAFTLGDESAREWMFNRVELRDPTGNLAESSSTGWSYAGDRLNFHFSPSLWPDDVWDLTVWAKRARSGEFAPDEMVSRFSLPLPDLGTKLELNDELVAGAATIRFESFEYKRPVTGDSWSSSRSSRLELVFTRPDENTYVDLIRVEDDRGREVEIGSWSTGGGTALGLTRGYSFKDISTNARTMHFDFAIHRGHKLTFRVQPELVTTNLVIPISSP